MKPKNQNVILLRQLLSVGLLGLAFALNARAESVFQAFLSNPPGGAQLSLGKFYFRVESDQVDFVAVIFPFGSLTANLDPVLSVPGSSINFSLGTGTSTLFYGARSIAYRNPFIPAEPWLPTGYDEDGIPFYYEAPVILAGDFYTGHFSLPPGFEADLLAGLGRIDFNPVLGGAIAVVPEPTALTMVFLSGLGWLARSRWLNHRQDRALER